MIHDPNRTFTWTLFAAMFTCALIGTVIAAGKAHAGGIEVFATSYNPTVAQNDSSPCVGASGRNLCTAAKEGDRTIALSRDLLWYRGGPYRWHDKVKLTSDVPQCNGVYSVEDSMHWRWKRRADLFFLTRNLNTSCRATIERVAY